MLFFYYYPQLLGDATSYTHTNVSLSDGQQYTVKVISCNAARLCNTSVSDNILVGFSTFIFKIK